MRKASIEFENEAAVKKAINLYNAKKLDDFELSVAAFVLNEREKTEKTLAKPKTAPAKAERTPKEPREKVVS